jgi:phage baseplate assembly protein W
MAEEEPTDAFTSFLGTGWSFPPEFVRETGEVRLVADEDDIRSSLGLLFGTAPGERVFNPRYGLDVRQFLFEPMSTTMRSFLEERAKLAVLFYEPRINVLSLKIDSPSPEGGQLLINLDYEIRTTNSRYNLVFPFYLGDGNEALGLLPLPPL